MKKNIKVILLVIGLVLLDQLSKYLVVIYLSNGYSLTLINNFLEFTFVKNTGAAFGMLSSSTIFLILISLFIIWYLIKEIKKENTKKFELFTLSLILGGSIGNLIDRIVRGYVVDFISFELFNKQMPVFNIADIFITIGIILQIIIIIMEENSGNNKDKRRKK